MNELFKYRLLSIDAWSEEEGGWVWNAAYTTDITIEFDGWPTTRKVLAALRHVEYLGDYSKGRLSVEEYGEADFEVRRRGTAEPICALERIIEPYFGDD